MCLDKVLLWGPRGPDWTKIAHAQLDQGGGQQNMTINSSLQYLLITEEIKEQDIVYAQTDGRPDDERVSHKLDWSSTSRAKNCIHSNSTLILH